MSNPVKKTSFNDLYETFAVICHKIDEALIEAKKKECCWSDHPNFKTFLKYIERNAIKETASELGMGNTTARDRWKILTLPTPVYNVIESDKYSFSKFKPLTTINFDFEKEEDIEIAEDLVKEVKKGTSAKDLKAIVAEKAKQIWNEKDIVMRRIAEQHGLTG